MTSGYTRPFMADAFGTSPAIDSTAARPYLPPAHNL